MGLGKKYTYIKNAKISIKRVVNVLYGDGDKNRESVTTITEFHLLVFSQNKSRAGKKENLSQTKKKN